MAGLVVVVHTWGPRFGSLMTGSVVSAVPLWIYGLMLSMPGQNLIVSLVTRAFYAILLYFGMRLYFIGWRKQKQSR